MKIRIKKLSTQKNSRVFSVLFLIGIFSLALGIFSSPASAATWQTLTSGTSAGLNDVHFINTSTGWAVGGGGTILKTTDGGTTWTAQTSGTTNALNGVFFINLNIGWIVGIKGTILKTTDGGTNWTLQTSGKEALKGVYFADANIGWIVGIKGTILKTTDGGTSWTAQASGTTNDLGKARSIYPADANNVWVVGDIGTILKTTDGGTTWTILTSGTTQNLRGVHFVDANTGWVTGNQGTILATENGGTTWTIDSSGTSNHLKGVSFADINNGWAVGDIGTILKHLIPTLSVSLSADSSGIVNQSYTATLEATGGIGTKTFSITNGLLPPGLSLDPNGTISGTPIQDGTFHFIIAVTDSQPTLIQKRFTIFVAPPPTPDIPSTSIVSADAIDPSAGGGVKLINENNTEIAVTIEADAVSPEIESYSIIVTSLNTLSIEYEDVPSTIGLLVANLNYKVEIINDATAQKITTFEKPITIKISYLEADLPAGTDESNLKIHFYNETTASWEVLDTVVDTVNNIATAQVSHLTRFALVAAAAPIIPSLPTIGGGGVAVSRKVGCERADFNNDRRVNLVDFSILAYWHKKKSLPAHLDLNNDGKIDLVEFSTLIYCWTR